MTTIGFTGTIKGMTKSQRSAVFDLMRELKPYKVAHGDCLGSDQIFHDIVMSLPFKTKVILHPPTNRKIRAFCRGDEVKPAKRFLERNIDIVNTNKLLIACPKELKEEGRSGTWFTVNYARNIKADTIIVYPNGYIE